MTYHAKDHASIVWSVCSNSKSVLFLVNMASFSTQMFVTLLGRLVRACLLRTAVSWNETVYLAASHHLHIGSPNWQTGGVIAHRLISLQIPRESSNVEPVHKCCLLPFGGTLHIGGIFSSELAIFRYCILGSWLFIKQCLIVVGFLYWLVFLVNWNHEPGFLLETKMWWLFFGISWYQAPTECALCSTSVVVLVVFEVARCGASTQLRPDLASTVGPSVRRHGTKGLASTGPLASYRVPQPHEHRLLSTTQEHNHVVL